MTKVGDLKCCLCGHTFDSHAHNFISGVTRCKALDASGDECDCNNFVADRNNPMKIKEALDTLTEPDWDALDAEIAPIVSSRPPKSFTVLEFAKRKGIGETKARTIFRSLVGEGKMTKMRVGSNVYYQLVKK